ncbi:MAG: hypothetical protein U9N85_09810, partial [Bacteroidota bacterium]|nr:hypothetical protein [Bacteroidota bacterium]
RGLFCKQHAQPPKTTAVFTATGFEACFANNMLSLRKNDSGVYCFMRSASGLVLQTTCSASENDNDVYCNRLRGLFCKQHAQPPKTTPAFTVTGFEACFANNMLSLRKNILLHRFTNLCIYHRLQGFANPRRYNSKKKPTPEDRLFNHKSQIKILHALSY